MGATKCETARGEGARNALTLGVPLLFGAHPDVGRAAHSTHARPKPRESATCAKHYEHFLPSLLRL